MYVERKMRVRTRDESWMQTRILDGVSMRILESGFGGKGWRMEGKREENRDGRDMTVRERELWESCSVLRPSLMEKPLGSILQRMKAHNDSVFGRMSGRFRNA